MDKRPALLPKKREAYVAIRRFMIDGDVTLREEEEKILNRWSKYKQKDNEKNQYSNQYSFQGNSCKALPETPFGILICHLFSVVFPRCRFTGSSLRWFHAFASGFYPLN